MIIIKNMLERTAERLREMETHEIVLLQGDLNNLRDVYIPYNEPITIVVDSLGEETIFIKNDLMGERRLHVKNMDFEKIEIK